MLGVTDETGQPSDPASLQASVLFIRGGADVMKFSYREEHVGYWSAGFDAVLARHGWTDVHTAEPEVLEHSHLLRGHDLVIVSWLPDWKTDWLRSLRAYGGVIFLEGPIPPLLESFAGLERTENGLGGGRCRVRLRKWLRDALATQHLDPEDPPIYFDTRDAHTPPTSRTQSATHLHQEVAERSPLRLTAFRNVAGDDELSVESCGKASVGVVRRGRVLTSSFRLLGHVVYGRMCSAGAHDERVTAVLEAALLTMLDEQLSRYGRDCIRIHQADPGGALARLHDRMVLSPGGLLGIEGQPPHAPYAGVRVRRLAEDRGSSLFELDGLVEGTATELVFRCPWRRFQGAETEGATLDVEPVRGQSEGVRIRISKVVSEPVHLRIHRTRSARYEEVAAAIASRGDRDFHEYAPEEVLPRVSNLTEVVNRFTRFPELTDLDVVDVGCGYGPFPLATALVERPRSLTGVDASAEVVRIATELASQVDAQSTTFRQGDLLSLGSSVDGVDLVFALNVLYYLPRRLHRHAAQSCLGAVRPGGAFVALVTNRRHPIDAFTGMRWVHRLPRWIADLYVRARGARHGYTDVRSPSPHELLHAYRWAGFEPVYLVDSDHITAVERARDYAKPRFYVVAIKPQR